MGFVTYWFGKIKYKIMKKIKYLLLSLLVGFSFASCNYKSPIHIPTIAGVTNIALTVSSPFSVIAEEALANKVIFTATLPNSFTSDVTVEARLVFDGGETIGTVTIPAGSTSGTGTLAMRSEGQINFYARPVKLILTGLSVSDPGPGEPSVYNVTSNEVLLESYDRIQWPYGAGVVAGRATILLDWENPGANDFDMFVFQSDFTQVESAASGSRWETDILDDTHPDGDYFIGVDLYAGSGDVPYKIFFVHPDQTTVDVFEGVFTAAQQGTFVFPVVNWTKSTVNGKSVYVTSQP